MASRPHSLLQPMDMPARPVTLRTGVLAAMVPVLLGVGAIKYVDNKQERHERTVLLSQQAEEQFRLAAQQAAARFCDNPNAASAIYRGMQVSAGDDGLSVDVVRSDGTRRSIALDCNSKLTL